MISILVIKILQQMLTSRPIKYSRAFKRLVLSPIIQGINIDRIEAHLTRRHMCNHLYNKLNALTHQWVEKYQDNCTGGTMRSLRGNSIEQFVIESINYIGIVTGRNFRAVKGDLDKKHLVIPDAPRITHQHQVDVHVYLDDRFIAAIECKAYLDKCYYTRACDDFSLFRKFGHNVNTYIFAFEDSISADSKIFVDYVAGNVCDDVFYMVDGKRSSSKPIYYPEHRKTINYIKFDKFIQQMVSLLDD